IWVSRRDRSRGTAFPLSGRSFATNQNDGRRGAMKKTLLIRRNLTVSSDHFFVWVHQSKWFLFAIFASPEPTDGFLIPRVHHEVKSPDPFDGETLSLTQGIGGQRKSSFFDLHNRPVRIPDFQMRSALGTSIRLSMESTVSGILIFRSAAVTHVESFHRRARSV